MSFPPSCCSKGRAFFLLFNFSAQPNDCLFFQCLRTNLFLSLSNHPFSRCFIPYVEANITSKLEFGTSISWFLFSLVSVLFSCLWSCPFMFLETSSGHATSFPLLVNKICFYSGDVMIDFAKCNYFLAKPLHNLQKSIVNIKFPTHVSLN